MRSPAAIEAGTPPPMRAPARLTSTRFTMYSLPPSRRRRTNRSAPSRRPRRESRPRSLTSRAKRALGIASQRPAASARATTVVRTTRVSSLVSKTISISAVLPGTRLSAGSRKNKRVALSSTCRCARSCTSDGKRKRNSAALAWRRSAVIGPPGPNARASTAMLAQFLACAASSSSRKAAPFGAAAAIPKPATFPQNCACAIAALRLRSGAR